MEDLHQENLKYWVKTWRHAETALREINRNELRTLDDKSNQRLVDEMLQWAYEHRQVRQSSGLVEQQKIFMKMKDKI